MRDVRLLHRPAGRGADGTTSCTSRCRPRGPTRRSATATTSTRTRWSDGIGDSVWLSAASTRVASSRDATSSGRSSSTASTQVNNRAIVLRFDKDNWDKAQSGVRLRPGRPALGRRPRGGDPALGHLDVAKYDAIDVRNVEATVIDNDTPGVRVTEIDPVTRRGRRPHPGHRGHRPVTGLEGRVPGRARRGPPRRATRSSSASTRQPATTRPIKLTDGGSGRFNPVTPVDPVHRRQLEHRRPGEHRGARRLRGGRPRDRHPLLRARQDVGHRLPRLTCDATATTCSRTSAPGSGLPRRRGHRQRDRRCRDAGERRPTLVVNDDPTTPLKDESKDSLHDPADAPRGGRQDRGRRDPRRTAWRT